MISHFKNSMRLSIGMALLLASLIACLSSCTFSGGYDYGDGGWHSGDDHWSDPFPGSHRHPHYPSHPGRGGGWDNRPSHPPIVVRPVPPRPPVEFRPLPPPPGGPNRPPRRPHMMLDMAQVDAAIVASDSAVSEAVIETDPIKLLAFDYAISEDSAETLLKLAKGKKLSKVLKKLGVEKDDIAPLLKMEMPAPEVIDQIAASLNEDSIKIEVLFAEFIEDVQN